MIIALILQMRNLNLRKHKQLVQCHATNGWVKILASLLDSKACMLNYYTNVKESEVQVRK